MSIDPYKTYNLRKELNTLIFSKNPKNTMNFIARNISKAYDLIAVGDSDEGGTYEGNMQSIINLLETSDTEAVISYVHKSSPRPQNAYSFSIYTPINCIFRSNISLSNKTQLIIATFRIYQHNNTHYTNRMMQSLLSQGDPTLITDVLSKAKIPSTSNTDKLSALLGRNDLSTFLHHPNIIKTLFPDTEKKCSTEIPKLIDDLLQYTGQNYSRCTFSKRETTDDKCSIIYKKLLEIYQTKMGKKATYHFVGVELILKKISSYNILDNTKPQKIHFLIDQIAEDDYTHYIPNSLNASDDTHLKCNAILRSHLKSDEGYKLKLVKFLLYIYNTFNFPLAEDIPSILERNHDLVEIILWSIKIGYHNPSLYQHLSKDSIKQLKAMQLQQLTSIRPFLNTYLTEKGLHKIISNYVGIDENLGTPKWDSYPPK